MTTTHRTQLISFFALAFYLFGFTTTSQAQTKFTIGPSKGQVIGASIGAGAVITAAIVIPVLIVRSHHNIKGCVLPAGTGLELRQDNAKTFALSGTTQDLKPGNLLSLHGSKMKTGKGSSDNSMFVVDRIAKDFGPCKLPTTGNSPATTP